MSAAGASLMPNPDPARWAPTWSTTYSSASIRQMSPGGACP